MHPLLAVPPGYKASLPASAGNLLWCRHHVTCSWQEHCDRQLHRRLWFCGLMKKKIKQNTQNKYCDQLVIIPVIQRIKHFLQRNPWFSCTVHNIRWKTNLILDSKTRSLSIFFLKKRKKKLTPLTPVHYVQAHTYSKWCTNCWVHGQREKYTLLFSTGH